MRGVTQNWPFHCKEHLLGNLWIWSEWNRGQVVMSHMFFWLVGVVKSVFVGVMRQSVCNLLSVSSRKNSLWIIFVIFLQVWDWLDENKSSQKYSKLPVAQARNNEKLEEHLKNRRLNLNWDILGGILCSKIQIIENLYSQKNALSGGWCGKREELEPICRQIDSTQYQKPFWANGCPVRSDPSGKIGLFQGWVSVGGGGHKERVNMVGVFCICIWK
jgi:hypothetical protein